MTKNALSNVVSFRVFLLAGVLIFGCLTNALSQNQVGATDSKETVVKTTQPEPSKSQMKVTFDETTPGVIYVESNGEKIRVDTNKKTVAQVTAPDEKLSETPKQETT